jgi:DNA-binding NarL/FixJ family response regulator
MQVLLVDRSEQITVLLEKIISEKEQISSIYKTVTYEEAIRLFKTYQPDAVVLDIGMPNEGSFKILKEIKSACCNTYVIMLSFQPDHATRENCMLSGVDFFFDKYDDIEKIPGLISTIAADKKNSTLDI